MQYAKINDIAIVKFKNNPQIFKGRVMEVYPDFIRISQGGGCYGGKPESITIIKSQEDEP